MLKQVLVLIAFVAIAFTEAAYFAFQTNERGPEFIVEIKKEEDIKHARDLLSGETTENPHILGRIIKTAAPYNPNYSYHIDPESLRFFYQAIEVCDASFTYTEENLDEAGGAFLPGYFFCPWTSRLIREVKSKSFYVQKYFLKQ